MNEKTIKMKRGRRIAYLKRCIVAHELLERHETDTSVRCRVFEKHIQSVLNCSYQTFNNMLNVRSPKKQLAEIMNETTPETTNDFY